MTAYLKNKFALSDKGAKNLVKAIWSCTFLYISFMFPVGLLYLVLRALLAPYVGITAKLQPLIVYVGISVVLIGIIGIFQYIEYNATFLASYEESANKRISIAERLREIPLSFFAKKDLSDLTTTIMSDCAGLEKAFSHFIPELLGAVISILLVGVGLLIFDYRMAIALLWVIPVAFLICIGGKNKQTKQNIIHQRAKLKRADAIKECIETVREIKANNQSEKYLANIDEILTYSEKINIKAELNTALYVASAQMLLRVGIATMVLMGVKLIAQGTLDFLTLLMFLIAVSRVFDPLSTALINLAAIFETELKVDRMKEIENQQIQSGKTNERFDNYDIKFENVKFSYKNNNKENVSFTAKQGEVTALVGPSGGGKSTVSKLAARFWDIKSGKITFGGKDISTIDPEELLKNYSIVFQDVVLFNSTVMENIRLGRRTASDEEVKKVAKMAMCDEFIEKLSNGYNTVIGENGSTLSGGERQRISIARALLKDAPIILLDEATASLDVENESKVQQAISTLIKDKTVLVIAHRMRTVAGADHIVVLADGKVKEEGNHDELLKADGLYSRLWNLQTKSSQWTI